MLRIAQHFGVSSSYMARVCSMMNVPRPERGYWAKLCVGKRVHKRALPKLGPGDMDVWSPGGGLVHHDRPLPKPPVRQSRRLHLQAAPSSGVHGLIRGAKELFQTGRLSYECGYLKPSKRRLVDLCVTEGCLEKALTFANDLFIAFERRGHRVMLQSSTERLDREEIDEREKPNGNHYNNLWPPARPTVVYIGTVAFGLTLFELSENVQAR